MIAVTMLFKIGILKIRSSNVISTQHSVTELDYRSPVDIRTGPVIHGTSVN